MEHGREPTVLPELLQDEDVGCYWGRPHDLWSGAERLQSLVSDSRVRVSSIMLPFVRVSPTNHTREERMGFIFKVKVKV